MAALNGAATGGAVFIGVARPRDIDQRLSGVAHERVTDVLFEPFSHDSVRRRGRVLRTLLTDERFWAASMSGPGTNARPR